MGFDDDRDEPTQIGKKLKDPVLPELKPELQEQADPELKDLVYKLKTFLNNKPDPEQWSPRLKELMGLLMASIQEKLNE